MVAAAVARQLDFMKLRFPGGYQFADRAGGEVGAAAQQLIQEAVGRAGVGRVAYIAGLVAQGAGVVAAAAVDADPSGKVGACRTGSAGFQYQLFAGKGLARKVCINGYNVAGVGFRQAEAVEKLPALAALGVKGGVPVPQEPVPVLPDVGRDAGVALVAFITLVTLVALVQLQTIVQDLQGVALDAVVRVGALGV